MKVLKSTTREFGAYMRILSESTPRQTVEAWGTPIEEARESTRSGLRELIPEGQSTPGHYFYTLCDGPTRLGYLWLTKRPGDRLWINGIHILSRFRSQGYGTKAMKWIESRARRSRCKAVGLDLYYTNVRAADFYRRCGYAPTVMTKPIT